MDEKRISELILAFLSGRMTKEDSSSLQQWREESPRNESLFQKLVSDAYLEHQYSRWRAVDPRGPQIMMERRISNRRYGKIGKTLLYLSGAAAMLAIGLWIGSHHKVTEHESESGTGLVCEVQQSKAKEITPGQQCAKLTTASGEVFKFSDSHKTADLKHKKKADREKLNNLEIPRGGEFHITLDDGTEVWLNAQTTLKYPEAFSSSLREVEISGEGYFKVAKDSLRPFIVKTHGQSIRVYGTEFNVNSYDDDSEVVTTLIEGSIALSFDNHSTNELVLAPGHQAVFSKENDETSIKTVNTDVVTSWINDMFVFDDQTLEKIMRQLSRWYDFDYSFEDQECAGIIFVGRIPRYAKFGDVLSILETSGGLSFDVTDRLVRIYHKK